MGREEGSEELAARCCWLHVDIRTIVIAMGSRDINMNGVIASIAKRSNVTGVTTTIAANAKATSYCQCDQVC